MTDFDKIIKDKIGSIEEMPPEHLWNNISKEINPAGIRIPFYKRTAVIITAAAASIAIIIGLGISLSDKKDIETINNELKPTKNTIVKENDSNNTEDIYIKEYTNSTKQEAPKNNISSDDKSLSNSKTKSTNPKIANPKQAPILIPRNNRINKTEQAPMENIAIKSNISNLKNLSKKAIFVIPVDEVNETATAKINETAIISQHKEEKTTKETPSLVEEAIYEVADTDIKESNNTNTISIVETISLNNSVTSNTATDQQITDINTNNPNDRIPQNNFRPKVANYDKYSIGTHFGLERIIDNNIKISAYNIDMSFNYQNMNFIAQTGVGLQFSDDQVSYNQQYISNDIMDSQIMFDSIAFVDDGNGGITPVPVSPYYENIYDSINHEYSSDLYKAYYSIRVPLFLGYQKSFKKISIFGKGGIIYSHIFRNDEGSVKDLGESARLIDVSYKNHERQNNQLQYVASTGISYSISKKLFFNVELMGKYYQYSLYKNSENSSNPWSFEARLGLIYLLN